MRLLFHCQPCLCLARHWQTLCQSKWLAIQVTISASPCWTGDIFVFWRTFVFCSFGEVAPSSDWSVAALSIYFDFAFIFVLRCYIFLMIELNIEQDCLTVYQLKIKLKTNYIF